MAFTALATRAYKDPVTTTYLNSIKQNDDYLFTGTIKAWINFDGSGGTLSARASLNIASLTDSGVGLYTITYTTGFSTSGYVALISCVNTATSTTENVILCGPREQVTGSTSFKCTNASFAASDPYAVCISIIGPQN